MTVKGKSSFGYLKKTAVKNGLFALGNVMICALIFLIGYFLVDKNSTIFTIVSVLGMLPAAKFIVSMLLFMKAEKFSCPKDLYDHLVQMAGDKKDDILCGFDFYLTSYEKNYPLCAALVKKGSLIAYTNSSKTDEQEAKKHLENYMKKNGISGIAVKIYKDQKKFEERFGQLIHDEDALTDSEKAMFGLLLDLSI